MIKYPVILMFLLSVSGWAVNAQETYLLKIQPQAGTEFRFVGNIKTFVKNGDEEVMNMNMEQNIASKITAANANEVTMVEKVEKVKGNSSSMGQTFDFDSSNPMAGNPTMNSVIEQLVGKEMTSRITANGVFIEGDNPFESLTGGGGKSDFRTLTGNARYPGHALKLGDSWTVIDTVVHQGITTISHTTWTLEDVKDDLAILSAKSTGNIIGKPAMMEDGKVEGTLSATGMAKIELKSGISRESNQRIEAKMNMSYEGQTQQLTSVTETAIKQVN